ncbi:hypothetical protein BGZ51_009543 [Haplosporangium sp. Z 767]|nr:hypothetical protein BGZ51_009543 [Haplosporangium sp. Z 767]
MKSVRQKWASHKTYRKIQRSWQDFAGLVDKRQVSISSQSSRLGDVQTVAQKLDIFLDTFNEAYQELAPQMEQEHVEMSVERLYGDCSDVMNTLFSAVEREMSLSEKEKSKCMQTPLDKAIALINLILKEEKYRHQIADTPDVISRLLSLLEKPGPAETKVLLLRTIATIGESDRNKIEIAKREGYKKILRLLIANNPELTQEVVRTVNHLLEFKEDHLDIADLALVTHGLPVLKESTPASVLSTPTKSGSIMNFSPKSLLSRSSVQLARHQSEDSALPPRPKSIVAERRLSRTSPFDTLRRQNSTSSVKSMIGIDRVSQAISEVRGIFVQELGKIFPQLKDQDGLGILGMGSDEAGNPSMEKHFIPNAEQIQFTIAYYSQLVGQSSAPCDVHGPSESPASETLSEPSDPSGPPEPSEKQEYQLHPAQLSSNPTLGQPTLANKLEKRGSLKKMVSSPDFHVTMRPALEARRNSDNKSSKATQGAAVELAREEELLRKSQPDNVLKEFMRTQGALRSLMAILQGSPRAQGNVDASKVQKTSISTGTKLATKIDIMETICKILFQNSANQLEFKSMDGYTTLLKVIDEIVIPNSGVRPTEPDTDTPTHISSYTDQSSSDHQWRLSGDSGSLTGVERMRSRSSPMANKRSLLLGSLMAVFFDLALDGSTRDMVQNTDAFHFLFRLLLESKQLDVRQQALYAIQDLISLSGLNAVAAWRCGEIDMIITQLRESLRFRADKGILYDAQWGVGRQIGLDPLSANIHNVVFTGLGYFDDFLISEDTAVLAELIEHGSPVYQYVIGLTRLLEYMAVMMTHDNTYILYELSRLLMEIEFPDDSSIIINIVLRSVGRIVSDMIARGTPVEEKFASIYLQIVRRVSENRLTCRQATFDCENEQKQEQERELRDCVHTEQRLLSLYILGIVIKGMRGYVEVFDLLQGFETLTSMILLEKRSCHHPSRHSPERASTYAESLAEPYLCQDCFRSDIVVSDLALWLFRDLALDDGASSIHGSVITWIIAMLKSTLSGIEELRRQTYLYTKICATVSLVFRKSDDSKSAFGEACGMQLLLSVLSSAQHPDIATAALVAIGDFFAGYEGTKALLGDSFGYDGFLEIVLDSCRPLDNCEIVLEVATVGNVMSIKSRPHVESDSSIYCTEVWPFIASLLGPQSLIHSAMAFTSPRKVSQRNSFRPNGSQLSLSKAEQSDSSLVYQTNGRGTLSRPSSVYLEDNLDSSGSGLTGVQVSAHGESILTLSAATTSRNAGVTSSGSTNRYSIFGISPWSSAQVPTVSFASPQEQIGAPLSVPQLLEPVESVGPGSSRSSVHIQRCGRSTPTSPGFEAHVSDDLAPMNAPSSSSRSLQVPKDKGSIVNRKRSNSRNLGGFGLNTTNLGFHSVVPSERLAFKQLAGIVFRDADAARMTLRLLGRIIECNNPKLATDYFNLLMLLMEVTPRNKELLGQNNGLRFILQILFRRGRLQEGLGINAAGYPFLPKITDPPYVDLVPAMGAYDISVEDVRLLFDAVYDPLDIFFRLTSDLNSAMPVLASTIKDSLGPLPELPAKFERDVGSRRNSAGRARSESASALTPYSGRRSGAKHSGINAGILSSMQFNPLFIGEMEQQMMYAIEKISERVDPPAYFNFNGLNATLTTHPGTVEKIVSAKGGYTVSFWVKVTAFLEKETGLFCYEEENGHRTIFELYFKSLDQSNRYCLCVRTQHYPSPPEDFVFDRFDFAETGIWHHIVFVHHKTMKLMVDGCVIQSYGTFNQRRQEKDGGMIGVLGRKGRNCMASMSSMSLPYNDVAGTANALLSASSQDVTSQQAMPSTSSSSASSSVQYHSPTPSSLQESSLGYFCGQTGTVHFLQGEWDQATAEKVYNLGPASTDPWMAHDVKSPVIAVLDPEDFKTDMEELDAAAKLTDPVRGPTALENQKTLLAHGVLRGGCTIHRTRAMRNLIGEVGGMNLCFRFLEVNPSHLQLVGLRVISNLLYKSPENIAQFQNELNGYEVLYELLLNTASELSVDHFGVLFDIAINGMIKNEHLILSNMPCVQLILRLLPNTIDSVQGYILRTLVDLIVESPENMRLWRASFGMTTLFELFKTLPAHLRPFLMWTLESMMDGMTVQELGLLIGFIGHEEPDLFEVRRDIIEMLFKRMMTDHELVDLLGSGLEGVTVLIGLLDSPNERFRIFVLKMIGILLSDNAKSGKTALDKPNIGIGLIRSTLEKYPLSMDVIQVLLGLAQNSYRCDPSFRSLEKGSGASSRKSAEKSSARHQPSPLSPLPLKGSLQKSTTPEKHSMPMMNTQDQNVHQPRTSLEEPVSTHAKPIDSSRQEHSATRKHVHSNSASAPFVKMSTLSAESVVISSAPSTVASTATTGHVLPVANGGAKITDELTYASMIRLIFELTGSLSHTDLVTHTLTDLKRLMTSENMRILWEAGWVNWVGAFLLNKAKVRVTSAAENLSYNRAMGVLDGMMQKMMIFDLSRKGSVTVRNKGSLVRGDEDVGVQLRLTEAALIWLDKNPNLDTDAANLICKGLVILFRRLEELSRKFEEKQRQEERIRQDALEKERERERLALEAVSSALNGVLDNMDDSGNSDESDTKSALLNPYEGDTDAEEVSVERIGDDSASSSPTRSSTSTLSLPLSTFSATIPTSSLGHQVSGESTGLQSASGSPPVDLHQHHHNHHRHHHQHSRQSRRVQPRASFVSSSHSDSTTPPAIADSTGTVLIHSQELAMVGNSGVTWPPLGLYEHFASCINNLACYNNSAIRTAMKSSGLFKIRDSLIAKLGRHGGPAGPDVVDGARYPYMATMHQHPHPHQQHEYSTLFSPTGQSRLAQQSASSNSSLVFLDSEANSNSSSIYNNNINPAIITNNTNYNTQSNTSNTGRLGPSNNSGRSRKRQGQQRLHSGLGLGMHTSVI